MTLAKALRRTVLVAGFTAVAITIAGCAPGSAGVGATPSPTNVAEQTPPVNDATDEGLDVAAISARCVEQAAAEDPSPVNVDASAAVVVPRDGDGLLFVAIPAQIEAKSSDGTVTMDGGVYCYLDPDTLNAVRSTDYVAVGFAVDLMGAEYDTYLNTPNPPTSLLD